MVGRFIDFHQAHVFAASDRNDNALCALHRHAVEQRVGNGAFRRFERTTVALCFAGAHHRFAHFVHDRTHIGKVEVDKTRHHHQIGNPAYALLQHFVSKQKRFFERRIRVRYQEQVLVRNNDQCIDMLLQLGNAGLARPHAALSFEQKRFGYNADRQDIHFASRARNNRRSTSAGTPAHARCDKAHMRPAQRLFYQI